MSSILITRATSGVAAACARRLAPRNHLVLVAADGNALEALRKELEPLAQRIDCVTDDLCNAAHLQTALAPLIGGKLYAVIHGDVENGVATETRALIPAYATVCEVALPMIQAGGAFAVIGSAEADAPGPRGAEYGAAQAYIDRHLLETRLVLKDRHVRMCYLAVGQVQDGNLTAADVADACAHVVEAPPHCCISRLELLPTERTSVGWVFGTVDPAK